MEDARIRLHKCVRQCVHMHTKLYLTNYWADFIPTLYVSTVGKFSSVQLKMASMRSRMPICAPSHPSGVYSASPLRWYRCLSGWRWPCPGLSLSAIAHCLFVHLFLAGGLHCGVVADDLSVGSSWVAWAPLTCPGEGPLQWWLCLPVCQPVHCPLLLHAQGSTSKWPCSVWSAGVDLTI